MSLLLASCTTQGMESLWHKIHQNLLAVVGSAQFKVWIAPLVFTYAENTVYIAAPSVFMAEFVRRRFLLPLEETVKKICGDGYHVVVSDMSSLERLNLNGFPSINFGKTCHSSSLAEGENIESGLGKAVENSVDQMLLGSDKNAIRIPAPRPLLGEQLALPVGMQAPAGLPAQVWRYSFDDFVVGPCNELAYAAAKSVSSGSLNTDMFFLSSPPGLGKTHLLHAAGKAFSCLCNSAQMRAAYLTAEEFANRFIHALRNKELDAFKGYFRTLDALLLEDVHFLQDKEKTQAELLATVKALEDRGAKVVLTSSFAPRELHKFDEQLLSRFYAGFLSSINRPDMETRRKIFRKKAALYQVQLPQEVEAVLADHIVLDVRQIESCVQNLILKARLCNSFITMQMAWEVIANYAQQACLCDAEGIVRNVCQVFDLSCDQLFSISRNQNYVLARGVAFLLLRKYTDLSLQAIGQQFNRRHSTVLKSITNLEREMSLNTPKGRQASQIISMIERNAKDRSTGQAFDHS